MPDERTHAAETDSLKTKLASRFGVIAFEGPIGVGKTTLAKRAADILNIRAVLDGSLPNPLLASFYSDRNRYAFSAQVQFLLNRRSLWSEIGKAKNGGPVLVDFIPQRDAIFSSILFEGAERALFESVYNAMYPPVHTVKPDAVVYLTADTGILMSRIGKRALDFEGRITRKYLQDISDAFHKYFMTPLGIPVLVVNTNDINIVEEEDSVRDIVRQLLDIGKEVQYYIPPTRQGER
ncbi:MAG: deoxynucleoside kinase [Candidatus Brocadiia bacterium]